jgi:outer membrane receptor protein involved in Fe transport
MRRMFRWCSTLPLLLIIITAAMFSFSIQGAWAQATTGSIYGRVADASQAVIPGAEVTAIGDRTGVSYRSSSDGLGNFTILNLPPGPYTVEVKKEGFETAKAINVVLDIDQKQLLNFELKVGAASTEVTVTTAPTMLQTESSETGEVIGSRDILDLPLLGRTFYSLTELTAGVVAQGGSINSFNFQANGQREYGNSIQIDGIESTSNRTQDITVVPSVDAIEEFKVATSSFSAEFGRSAGAEVSIQTKAGTNQWHGDLYEFFRPNFTAARNYGFLGITTPPSTLKQHNYGGTFGGPIRRDKTFFFVSYEGTHENSANDGVFNTLPISQIKIDPDGSVDLSGLIDPLAGTPNVPAGQVIPIFNPQVSFALCPPPNPTGAGGCASQQFPGNIIPASQVSTAGLNTVLDFFAAPNRAGDHNGWFNNYQYHYPTTYRQKQADARLDHNFSQKDRLSAVFHYNDSQILDENIYYGHTVVPGADDTDFANKQNSGAQSYIVSETHLFSSRFLNEARFGYTRYYINQYSLLDGTDYSTEYGMNNVGIPGFPATFAYPYIQLYSGYFTGGSSYKPLLLQDHNWQISDNLTLSGVGKHEIKFGGDFRRLNSFPFFTIFPTGYQYYGAYFSPSTSDPTFGYYNPYAWFPNGGSDISDLLTGLPFVTYIGLQLTNPHTQSWEMSYFAQDTFKLTPRLTLNYGLRYEYHAPYLDANNNASNYDPTTDSFLLAGRGSNSRGLVNPQRTNFAPRLGLSYLVHPKTVVRAGIGLFFSPENDGREDILSRNYPFSNLSQYEDYYYNGPCNPATQPACDGIYNYQLDQGIPRNTSLNIPPGASSIPSASIPFGQGPLLTSYYVNPDMKTGYSANYNLSLQQQLTADFALDIAYVGSRGRRLSYAIGDFNFNPADGKDDRITTNLGKIEAQTDVGLSNYNSLQVKLTKRVSRNLNFLATYTWSHSIDNGPSPFDLGLNSNYPQDAYNLKSEIASSDTDVRNNFTFSGLYRLPIGRGQALFSHWGKVQEFLLGGWQLNGLVLAESGMPVNVVRGASLSTCPGVRPDLVGNPNGPPPPQLSPGAPPYAFNIDAFSVPSSLTGCTPGTAGRNLVHGLSYKRLDSSIFKEFGIGEKYRLQTRLETFNTTNTPHFGAPDGVFTDGTFGELTAPGSGTMRQVQLAAKFIF